MYLWKLFRSRRHKEGQRIESAAKFFIFDGMMAYVCVLMYSEANFRLLQHFIRHKLSVKI